MLLKNIQIYYNIDRDSIILTPEMIVSVKKLDQYGMHTLYKMRDAELRKIADSLSPT